MGIRTIWRKNLACQVSPQVCWLTCLKVSPQCKLLQLCMCGIPWQISCWQLGADNALMQSLTSPKAPQTVAWTLLGTMLSDSFCVWSNNLRAYVTKSFRNNFAISVWARRHFATTGNRGSKLPAPGPSGRTRDTRALQLRGDSCINSRTRHPSTAAWMWDGHSFNPAADILRPFYTHLGVLLVLVFQTEHFSNNLSCLQGR